MPGLNTVEELKRVDMLQVQRDPYGHLMSNWEVQMAKQLPLRMFFNAVAMGAFSLYYLSRHNEIQRIRNFRFSVDMVVQVSVRALGAGIVADFCTRKAFINYDALRNHKAANNEIKKVMRTFPNRRPYLAVWEKPNSYLLA